ncbi:serine/threonine protein kinase [Fischerella thermalis CCMEE 5268]|uniref:non-specific serine/threonine protein kinase n=1 Tax=Fischerella thermalis CCMEE 5268 TaxID=2019662 RepID=A0A2N6KAJ4_9CYAN|nr:serine/threonine-protein kinase [Fischerella thermalis]PLZ95373.1 serine/threonine protein kinase [Fischerella thermalis CCMEE 5268]
MLFGKVLRNRYKILKKLGSGGFGDTFLAEDMDLPGNPTCVVKHLQTRNPNPEILQIAKRLFNQEAEVLYRLGKHHEQIPELLAHFEENGEFYLVQEFIDGHDLTTEIIPGKQLSETQVLKLLKEILEVLAVVHEHGVIHRDIKLQNIMRRRDGKIVLIDFGSVKEIKSLATNTEGEVNSTIVIGTPGYIPNEQANGKPRLSSDVYAVGMLGIQALTGVQPRKLPTDPADGEVVWRNLVSISNELANILTKMVRCNFKERYQTAGEALQALQAPSSPPSTIQQIPPPKAKTPYGSSSRASRTQGFPALGLFSLIGVGFGLVMFGKTFLPFNLQENQPTKTTNPAVENTNNQPQASPSVTNNKRSKNFFTPPPTISPSIFTPQRDSTSKPATPAPSPSPTKNDTKSSQPVVKEETNLFPPPPTEREFRLPPPATEEEIQPYIPPPPPPTKIESQPSPSATEEEIQPSTPPPPTKTESRPSTPPTTENDVPAAPLPTPATEEPNQQMMVVPTTPVTEEPTQQKTILPTTPATEESNQQNTVVPTTTVTEEPTQQMMVTPTIPTTEEATQQMMVAPSTQVTEQPTQEMMVVPATPTAGG